MSDDDARRAIQKEIASRGMSQGAFARAARIDPSTLSDYLSGERTARPTTLAKIDRYLEWEPGTLAAIVDGLEPATGAGGSGVRVEFVVDEEWNQLSVPEMHEAISVAKAAFLERAREIVQSRSPLPGDDDGGRHLGRGVGRLVPIGAQASSIYESFAELMRQAQAEREEISALLREAKTYSTFEEASERARASSADVHHLPVRKPVSEPEAMVAHETEGGLEEIEREQEETMEDP